jgi:hypothetical protein
MMHYPYFANKILDDYEMSNEEKQDEIMDNLTNEDKKEGKLILVDGAKRGGKTGFGMWLIDRYHERKPNLNYCFVSKRDNHPPLPSWFKFFKSVDELPNDCIALVDEGAINLNARRAMSKENVDASEELVILAHKGITLIILVQHIKMVDSNVRRTADIRVLKFGINFGSDDNTSDDVKLIRSRLKPKNKTEAYIEIGAYQIYRRLTHGLPSWWNDAVSKSWRDTHKSIDNKKESKKSVLDLLQ